MRRTHKVHTAAEGIAFDAFPQYKDGGPSMVVLPGWGVSYGSLSRLFSSPSIVAADDGKVTLSAYAAPYTGEKHPLDGTKYPTEVDARKAAYEAGLIGFMVYDDSRFALEVSA